MGLLPHLGLAGGREWAVRAFPEAGQRAPGTHGLARGDHLTAWLSEASSCRPALLPPLSQQRWETCVPAEARRQSDARRTGWGVCRSQTAVQTLSSCVVSNTHFPSEPPFPFMMAITGQLRSGDGELADTHRRPLLAMSTSAVLCCLPLERLPAAPRPACAGASGRSVLPSSVLHHARAGDSHQPEEWAKTQLKESAGWGLLPRNRLPEVPGCPSSSAAPQTPRPPVKAEGTQRSHPRARTGSMVAAIGVGDFPSTKRN